MDFPTTWEWASIASFGAASALLTLRMRRPGRVANVLLILSIIALLFCLMEWASWYK